MEGGWGGKVHAMAVDHPRIVKKDADIVSKTETLRVFVWI